MTTSVIISLTIANSPERLISVHLPVLCDKVMCYGHENDSDGFVLKDFLHCCECQAKAMTLIADESNSVLDSHIGGLMAFIMAEISTMEQFSETTLCMSVDCFSYMLKADGFTHDEIVKMRPQIIQTIRGLYPENIKG